MVSRPKECKTFIQHQVLRQWETLLTTESNNDLIFLNFGHPPFISLKECKHEALLLLSGDK